MRNRFIVIVFISCTLPNLLFGNGDVVINEQFKNAPLKEVLRTLRDNYQLKIAFTDKFVRDIEINASINNLNVYDTFSKVLEGTDLTFELVSANTVIIKRKKTELVEVASTFELTAVVSDAISGEELPYAYVWVNSRQQNIMANVEGYFSIPSVNEQTQLNISYLGYNDTLLTISDDYRNRRLQIKLQPNYVELEDVLVESEKETNDFKSEEQAGKFTMNPAIAQKTPSVGEEDVFRTLQLLPGVNATNEASSGLSINGGTSNQNLVLFDGFTVYHVDHFFGYFSAFNPLAIKSLRLYKGGFESKYGGRVSSVVDISGKDGNRNKTSGSLGVNLLSVNTSLEVPLSDNGATLFFSGRRSYTDIWSSSLFENIFSIFESSITEDQDAQIPGAVRSIRSELIPDFYYTDLNLKISTRISPKNHLSFSFYDSNDILNYTETSQTRYRDTLRVDTDKLGIIKWGNVGTSLNLSRLWNTSHYSSLLLSYSNYESTYNERATSKSVSRTEGEFESSTKQDQVNSIEDVSLKFDHEWDINSSSKIETGVMVSLYNNEFRYEADDSVLVDNSMNQASLLAHYIQGSFYLNPSFSFTPGLRTSYLSTTQKVYLEPRLSFLYQLNSSFQLKGATGLYNQFINQSNTKNVLEGSRDFWILANDKTVPVQHAWHGLLSLEYNKGGHVFSVSYFRKEFDGLLEYAFKNGSLITQFDDERRVFDEGKGTSKGLEFMVKRDFGKLSSWLSYTLSEVKYTFPRLNRGKSYFADHDQRHELNWYGTYTYKNFEFSATWVYGSGKPYSTFDGIETRKPSDDRGPTIGKLNFTEKNGERLPEYHRLDVSAKYRFQLGLGSAYVALSIFNLYDRENVFDTKVSVIAPADSRNRRNPIISSTNVALMGITPNLSFGIEF
ncbi:carboxypeptidase-like regulatory domain-containing protein [Roseivirga echinicomitans]|uniref:carboxypeptidase-like regulatory domain-containing protein n=1 Tax=Roseivirga echinicomitans TaxID=296218 RepID=UPI0009FC8EFF|nr:carboxypeptidase-like regulatory domain-containing protein [Roseivirga echinicomitans]